MGKRIGKKEIFLIPVFIALILIFEYRTDIQAEEKIVKVGYPIQHGLTEIDENGAYTGYSYEYLMEIAKYTDWKYEFIQVDGAIDEQLSTFLELLKTGEIDILGAIVYSEELSKLYDYCGYNYGTSYYTLCALDDNIELTSQNYYLKSDLKVGVISSKGNRNKELDQFAEMNGMVIEQVFYNTEEELYDSLAQGTIDMLLTRDISIPRDKYRIIARFSPTPYYFATTKGNKEIVTGLNSAMEALTKANPYFITNLQEKYFSNESNKLIFSKEEKEYLASVDKLTAVMIGGKAPIQYLDLNTGEYKGISVDVLHYVSQELGIPFEIRMMNSMEEIEQIIENKEADVMMGVTDELVQYDWQKMKMSMPYLTAPICIVMNKGINPNQLDERFLVLPEGTSYQGTYKGMLNYYKTPQECLMAVHKGKADYTYVNTYTAQYYISNPEVKNLFTIPQTEEWIQKFCFAVVDSQNTVLLGILNKMVQSLSDGKLIQSYLYENAYQVNDVTLLSYLRTNTSEALMIVVTILCIILTILLISRWKERKSAFIRSLENARYEQISKLSNEFLFEYDIESDTLKLPEISASFLNMPKEVKNISTYNGKYQEILQFILKKENKSDEIRVDWENGKKRWIRIITKAITDKTKVIYVVGKLMDIQNEIEEKEKLLKKAQKDSLTGVYNMATFREYIAEIEEELKQRSYALIIMDVDHFKEVNDSYGHYIGDFVLENIGKILRHTFRREDLKGRLGGDEFVVFMQCDGQVEWIEEKCRILRRKIGDITFENQKSPITVSIGAALASSGNDFDTVYQNADAALYEVKAEGRNGFKLYEAIKSEKENKV